ncbi:vitamin K epoxide reductase family protein [Patescibacteria group bacterium]|nr:vitamin K epoxide reductase family protein [Patescibacteria group bacterium]
MRNFKLSSIKPSPTIPNWLVVLFLVLSGAGFLDASYLTTKHYLGTPINCSLLNGCDAVTTSAYSMVSGLPVALLGAFYYFTIFIFVMLYVDTGAVNLFFVAVLITPLGFLASLWFMYVQIFVIHALCLYCLLSALISTLLFGFGIFVLTLKGRLHITS